LSINRLGLGRIAYKEGLYEQAKQYYEESLTISQEIGDQRAIATSFSDLGDVTRASGDYQGCRRHFQDALEIATNTWTTPLILDSATRTAELLVITRREETALALVTFVMQHYTGHKAIRDRAELLFSGLTSKLPVQLAEAAQACGQSWDFDTAVAELRAELEA